jgi:hypothetical protein
VREFGLVHRRQPLVEPVEEAERKRGVVGLVARDATPDPHVLNRPGGLVSQITAGTQPANTS